MREKRRLLTVIITMIALSIYMLPAMRVKAEGMWINMDGSEEDGYLIEYYYDPEDASATRLKATIYNNDGLMVWDGTSGSQSMASMFGTMKFESLTIGKDVTRLDNRALSPLKNLEALIIEDDNSKLKLQDGMVVNKAGNIVYLVLNSYTDANVGVITLPDTITEIGNHAFDHNKNIKVVNAPKVTGIGNWAFDGSTITKFTCENLNYIGENSFQNCEKLEDFVMDTDDGVNLVSSSFIGCKKLKAFPYKTGDITMNAFSGCESLESFTIGSNVNKIESCGFKHCISLTEMTIPSSVTTIGNSAFDDCQNLKTVTFESATPPTVGEDVFTSCPSDMKIIVPAGAEEAYVEAFGLDYYDNIYETGVVKYGVFINGVQFTNQKTSIQCGEGTAVYDPDTETLTLNHVTVNESTIVKLFGSWLHGGSIYSSIDNLTIIVNGENYISADADGISTISGANVTIKGTGKLVLDTLATSDPQMASAYVGLGDDPTGVDGGDLIIDGPEIVASRELQANRNLIIQGGSKVTCGGRLRSNNNGDIKILDGADVTAKTIDMGLPADMFSQEVYQRDMHVVLDGGKLTLQGLERTYGDNTWTVNGIFFCPNIGEDTDPRGYIEIKDGVLIVEKPVEAGKSFTDCPDDHILISDGFEDESDGTELTVEEFKQGAFSVSSHKFGPWEKLDDEYHQRTCSGNGKHAAHSEQAEHSWDDGVVTKEATFEEEGEKTFTCKYCHATKTEKIEKLSGPATPTPTATPSQEPTPSVEPTSSPSAVPTSEATPSTVPTESPSTSAAPAATPTPDPTTQMGKDGTAVGEGASLEAADKAITSMTTDDDPAGSVFNVLQAKAAKVTKNSIKVSWKKPAGAVKFVVYANKCGKGIKPVKITEVTGTNFTLKKLDGKALKKGTYYKFLIVSVDKDNKVISTSKVVHAATSGGKVGNVKKITTKAKKDKVSLKAKKSFKLKAKQVAKSKKMKVKKHRVLKYETTDPAVATVNAKGVIKAVAKGNCLVYVYSQDGVCKKIKVTVK